MSEFVDVSSTIAPKSDQLNADDLIKGPMTVKITRVRLTGGEQPVAISFEGDGGKPFLPGKSMRRVLVLIWGDDGASYVGKSMTLYRDEKVIFGGVAVGGIRISHMSGLSAPRTMALTASKAKRAPFTVLPLVEDTGPSLSALVAKATVLASRGVDTYKTFFAGLTRAEQKALLPEHARIKQIAVDADARGIIDNDPNMTDELEHM